MYPPCIGGNFMDNQLFLEIRPLRNHQWCRSRPVYSSAQYPRFGLYQGSPLHGAPACACRRHPSHSWQPRIPHQSKGCGSCPDGCERCKRRIKFRHSDLASKCSHSGSQHCRNQGQALATGTGLSPLCQPACRRIRQPATIWTGKNCLRSNPSTLSSPAATKGSGKIPILRNK